MKNPTECDAEDVQKLEEIGAGMVNQFEEFVMNIDVATNQFTLNGLYEEAQKLGLEFDDLKEYGFDFKGDSCGGKMCFKGGKSYEDFVKNASLASSKTAIKAIDNYQKVSCHPFVKKHVTPKV